MHSVIWTFRFPEGTDKAMIHGTIAEDRRTMCGIYLWNSRAEADAFYTPAWVRMVSDRWSVSPSRGDWETQMVVETEAGMLRTAAPAARAAE